jgi:hypothetical protein
MPKALFLFAFAMVLASGVDRYCFSDTIPGIPFCKQEKKYWCWVASSQTLLKFYVPGFNKTQTQIATTFGPNTGTSASDTIVKTKIPELIAINSVVNGVRYLTAEYLNHALTWPEMKAMGDNKLPFTIMYHWPSQSPNMYHCVIYAGYINDSTRIKIVDPDMLSGTQTYERSYKQLTGTSLPSWSYTLVPHKVTTSSMHPELITPPAFSLVAARHGEGMQFCIAGAGRSPQKFGLSIVAMNGQTVWKNSIGANETVVLPWLSAGDYCAHASGEHLNLTETFIFSH